MNDRIFIPDETAMQSLGQRLAKKSKAGDLIYFIGDLGAGKTTLIRGFLRELGIKSAIKSPTFTLVECYQIDEMHIYHFDLYRLKDPHEIIDIGFNDYLTPDAICLVEWPEKAANYLPEATQYCTIEIPDNSEGRWVTLR